MSPKEKDILASWERDPNQGFTPGELQILRARGLIREEVHTIL